VARYPQASSQAGVARNRRSVVYRAKRLIRKRSLLGMTNFRQALTPRPAFLTTQSRRWRGGSAVQSIGLFLRKTAGCRCVIHGLWRDKWRAFHHGCAAMLHVLFWLGALLYESKSGATGSVLRLMNAGTSHLNATPDAEIPATTDTP
jgi:hypothetical protein